MVRPALGLLLAGMLCLSGCGGFPPEGQQAAPTVALPVPRPQGPPSVALLLPLSGPNALVAEQMRDAALLAGAAPGAPSLDIRDTGGDPARAGQQAQAAIAAGDHLILGPLTAEETEAVGTVAVSANVPVLSFSSDPAVAAPGVWGLGITPGQQMRRLIAAARAEGRQRLAALLPQGAFGDAMQIAIVDAAGPAGFDPPNIQRAGTDPASLDAALKSLSDYQGRRGEVQSRIEAMRTSSDPATRQQAALLAAQPMGAPPFDALVLAFNGEPLRQIAGELSVVGIIAPQVRVLGPSFWSSGAAHQGHLAGAWYAVPDPSQRDGFVQAYSGKYGAAPPPIADLAFDAVLIGRALAGDHDFSAGALTRPDGFSGVDGALVLLPDGHVKRAFAIYQIDPGGGAHIVSPAPTDLTTPGS